MEVTLNLGTKRSKISHVFVITLLTEGRIAGNYIPVAQIVSHKARVVFDSRAKRSMHCYNEVHILFMTSAFALPSIIQTQTNLEVFTSCIESTVNHDRENE